MKNQICQLCCCDYDNAVASSNSNLINLIYKHLHITIQDIHNVCIQCEQIIIHWDQFAQKCWTTQTILQENQIKFENEFIPIKEENFPEVCIKTEEEYSDEDKYSPSECSTKMENPTTQYESDLTDSETKKGKSTSKIKSATKKNNRRIRKRKFDCIIMVCHVCSVVQDSWSILESHCLKEHSTKPKVLCICGKYLGSESSISRHRVMHNEEKGVKCEQCDDKFLNNSSLKIHILKAHTSKDEYPHSCDQCEKKFVSVKSLKKHKTIHLPADLIEKYPCDICDAVLKGLSGLKAHKITKHENLRTFICDECGKAFSTKSNLNEHKSRHSDQRDYKCDKCDKRFKFKYSVKIHQETHNEAGFKCPKCPAILSSRRGLRNHADLHIPDKKFDCTLCGKKFRRRYHLTTHLKTHSGIESYKCEFCPSMFSDDQSLRLHKEDKHEIEMKDEK